MIPFTMRVIFMTAITSQPMASSSQGSFGLVPRMAISVCSFPFDWETTSQPSGLISLCYFLALKGAFGGGSFDSSDAINSDDAQRAAVDACEDFVIARLKA